MSLFKPVGTEAPQAPAAEFRGGWTTLLGATLGAALGIAALPFYTFGIFMRAIEAGEHWSRSEIALAQTCWAIVLALMSPVVGRLIDRFGYRRPIGVSLIAVTACFTMLATVVKSPVAFISVYTLMALLGAASSPLPFAKAVSGKFKRARGIALGITLTGTGLAALIAPVFLGPIIQQHGWRAGYLAMAGTILVLGPMALILIGKGAPAEAVRRTTHGADLSIRSALGAVAFWQLAGIFTAVTLATSGLVAHLVPILTDAGVSPVKAAGIVGIVGLSVMAGRLGIGFLIDLFRVRYVAGGAFFVTAAGCFLLMQFGPAFAWAPAIGVGVALGAEVDLMGYCTARYFGLRNYGVIYGVLYGLSILGVAASPVWMALVSQSAGYHPVLIISTAVALAASALCLGLPRADAAKATIL